MAEKACPGGNLQIQRQPDNPHDGNPVQLLFDGQELGYVPARHAIWVADTIDNQRSLLIEITEIRASGDAQQVELYLGTRNLNYMDAF